MAQVTPRGRQATAVAVLTALLALPVSVDAAAQATDTITLRGRPQKLYLYGRRGTGDPVIVTSGDGGWIHLGPQVAQLLASRGYFVVGFDARAYLESFTQGDQTLRTEDEPTDYHVLADYAARGATVKPLLVGVSEGAGLSLLAATDPATKAAVRGVIGVGLPDQIELGWRWRDAMIYLTHGTPSEPMFSATEVAGRVPPLPLAAIHSTRDEYVPLTEVQKVLAAAREPKRLWIVNASDHRFSDNPSEFAARLLEAIDWIDAQGR
jgi:fermentation-respiration switch protein FrsA (DUF1100 family)